MTAPAILHEIVGAPAARELDDPALVDLVREGELDAYVALRERHAYAARRLASALGMRDDTDGLVSEAFAYTFELMNRGDDLNRSFRELLFTTIRQEARSRADELHLRLRGRDSRGGYESSPVDAAYDSLPEQSRTALWHLDVEGQTPAELAVELGLTRLALSALIYRARSTMRQAYLEQHVRPGAPTGGRTCRRARARMSALLRRDMPDRETEHIHAHLARCADCMSDYLNLGGPTISFGKSVPTR